MTRAELRKRTFVFAERTYRLARPLLRNVESRHIAIQLIKATTSVASNYRASCLSRSGAEWTAKMGTVREESDESLFWVQFIVAVELLPRSEELDWVADEARQLALIMSAAYWTSKNEGGRQHGREDAGRSRKRTGQSKKQESSEINKSANQQISEC
jgi:four helix bundle protein